MVEGSKSSSVADCNVRKISRTRGQLGFDSARNAVNKAACSQLARRFGSETMQNQKRREMKILQYLRIGSRTPMSPGVILCSRYSQTHSSTNGIKPSCRRVAFLINLILDFRSPPRPAIPVRPAGFTAICQRHKSTGITRWVGGKLLQPAHASTALLKRATSDSAGLALFSSGDKWLTADASR